MNPSGSVPAFVGTLVDAQRAWSALGGHGIEAWLLGQHLGGYAQTGSVVVAVREEDLARAAEVLEASGIGAQGE